MRNLLLLTACLLSACSAPKLPAQHAALSGESFEVEPGVPLYYERAGDGPTLVLVQGAQMDLRQWDEVFAELTQDFDVIRYDVRGFGRSGHSEHPYQHHVDLWALLEALDVPSAHIVGLSLGGRIAIDLALEAPQRVRTLVLSGPGISGFAFDDDSFAAIGEARQTGDPAQVAEAWLAHGYIAPSMELPELAPRIRMLAHENAEVWLRSDPEVPLEVPAIVRLEELAVPALLLLGSRDEPDIHAIANLLEAGMSELERVDVEGAGHLLPMERPRWFADEVARFIAAADR